MHIVSDFDVNKERGQRKWLVEFVSQTDVSVAGSQAFHRKHAVTQQTIVLVVHGDAQSGEGRENNLKMRLQIAHSTQDIYCRHIYFT